MCVTAATLYMTLSSFHGVSVRDRIENCLKSKFEALGKLGRLLCVISGASQSAALPPQLMCCFEEHLSANIYWHTYGILQRTVVPLRYVNVYQAVCGQYDKSRYIFKVVLLILSCPFESALAVTLLELIKQAPCLAPVYRHSYHKYQMRIVYIGTVQSL